MDPDTKAPFIILKEVEGEQAMPIWIGLFEARAIASEMQGLRLPRPETHELLRNIMDKTKSEVTRVEICDLRDNTYYVLIHLTNRGKSVAIDSRRSDAIALALRTKAPIYVSEEVLKKYKQVEAVGESVAVDKSKQRKSWQDILEKLKPEDFGKYKV